MTPQERALPRARRRGVVAPPHKQEIDEEQLRSATAEIEATARYVVQRLALHFFGDVPPTIEP